MLLVPATIALFAVLRPPLATATLLVGAVMFLPEGVSFDPPGLPSMDKASVAALCATAACLVTCGAAMVRAKPGRGFDWFAIGGALAAAGTVLTNRDPLEHGSTVLPPMTMHDATASVMRMVFIPYVPFFLGRALFRTSRELQGLMRLLAVAGMVYVPLVLLEVRLSPKLHGWFYGFQPGGVAQRAGGYEPTVFLPNGLALAMFMATALLATCALVRTRANVFGFPAGVAGVTLAVTLVLGKAMAAMVYTAALAPVILLARAKVGLRVAVALMILVAAYPSLRVAGQFPTDTLVGLGAHVSQDRAQSLQFRFDNEDALLAKALDRIWFGWGTWGRNRVYDEYGQDVSVTDGEWIIRLTENGAIGWGCFLGLLLGPVVVAARRVNKLRSRKDRELITALALIVAVYSVDLLPNALFTFLPLFLSGCLWGLTTGIADEEKSPGAAVSLGPRHFPPNAWRRRGA
jgi:hypothetical protein